MLYPGGLLVWALPPSSPMYRLSYVGGLSTVFCPGVRVPAGGRYMTMMLTVPPVLGSAVVV